MINLHRAWDSELFVLAGASRTDLLHRCEALFSWLEGRPAISPCDLAYTLNCLEVHDLPIRLCIVAATLDELAERLSHARRKLADASVRRIQERAGVYFYEEPLGRTGGVAFLFPGEGAQYVNMLADLCLHFPEVRAWFDLIDRACSRLERSYLPSEVVFPATSAGAIAEAEERLWQMDCGAEAVFTANQALLTLLTRLEIRPDAMVGHSGGDSSALCAAGVAGTGGEEQLIQNVLEMNAIYVRLARSGKIPEGALLAVSVPKRELLTSLVERSDGALTIAMDNCPHQVVLWGNGQAVGSAAEHLRRAGGMLTELPFARAYHTPAFSVVCAEYKQFFERLNVIPPRTTVYSASTAEAYPTQPDEIRAIAAEQWARPLRFRETIQKMYADGIRIFVEVGPKGNLTGFVTDCLAEQPHLAVPANVTYRSGISQLNHLLGLLVAHGVQARLDYLYAPRSPRRVSLVGMASAPANGRQALKVATGLPTLADVALSVRPVERQRPINGAIPTHAAPDDRQDVMRAYLQTMQRFVTIQQQLMESFMTGASPEIQHATAQPATQLAIPQIATPPQQETRQIASLDQQEDVEDPTTNGVGSALLALVSARTGYPVDMLTPSVNLEADLGIDSIKRIEILGALLRSDQAAPTVDMERLAGMKTLGEIIAVLESTSAPDPASVTDRYPLLGTVLSHGAGELTAVRTFDLNEDLYLRDHTFGGCVSALDPELTGLPIVPLTISIEVLAEAAAALSSKRVVIGMREVRASRWLSLAHGPLTVRLRATRIAEVSGIEDIHVTLTEGSDTSGGVFNPPAVEATVVLADAYPEAPAWTIPELRVAQPSRWSPESLYSDGMFHGPAFRGVASVDRCGEDGLDATLRVLSPTGLFRSTSAPHLLTDASLLDAAGQLVGFWTMDRLDNAFNVFPYRVEQVSWYAPTPAGGMLKSAARSRLIGDWQVTSRIDVADRDGHVLLSVKGWEDRRFALPERFTWLRIAPGEADVAEAWDGPLEHVTDRTRVACSRLDSLDTELLEAHGHVWRDVLAHLVLSRREREAWCRMDASDRRASDWIRGRAAAKSAVRLLMLRNGLPTPNHADIDIDKDARGRPFVRSAGTDDGDWLPLISVSHSGGIAAAVAADPRLCSGIGIDIEVHGRDPARLDDAVLTPGERRLLDGIGAAFREEWWLRLWCAKEAVAKALGLGLARGPASIEVKDCDRASGSMCLFASGRGLVTAHTVRDGQVVVATATIAEDG